MNLRRLKALSKKEFKHILRDIRMLSILLIFPVFLLIVFGYAVRFDVENINLAVKDNDKSQLSSDFIKSFIHSKYFSFTKLIEKDADVKIVLDEKQAQCVLIIPAGFARDFYSNKNVNVQFLLDGVDGNTATVIYGYAQTATASFNNALTEKNLLRAGIKQLKPLDVRPTLWFNPDLKTTRFLIPGLIGMILIISGVVSVSLSLVREKEKGTIEQINVSPISSLELLVGKSLPYFLLALFDAALILVAGYYIFDVAVKGSMILLIFSTVIFIACAIALGIFISVLSNSQQVAFTVATFTSLLPSVILSGFIFPIESMPLPIQIISNITPVKFYIVTLRAIMLRGAGLSAFWQQWVYMLLFTSTLLTLAAIRFTKQMKNN